MSVSDKVKAVMALSGKRQIDLAEEFGMSKQAMSNKFAKNSWFAKDLVKVANFCGGQLMFVLPNGQQIIIEDNSDQDMV